MARAKFTTISNKDALITIKCELPDKVLSAEISESTLQYDIDDPYTVLKAIMKQPYEFAKWSLMYHTAKTIKADIEKARGRWHTKMRQAVTKQLLQERKSAKLKSPTKDDIESYIRNKYADEYNEFEDKLSKIENKIGLIGIAVDTYNQRKSLLKNASDLVNTMINNDLLIIKNKLGNRKKD